MNPIAAESRPVAAVCLSRSHPWIGVRSIEIVRDGESVFFQTNEFGTRPEIGTWRHAVPVSMFQDLLLRLDDLSRATPENGHMVPGQMSTTFEITRAGESEPSYLSIHPNQPELPDAIAQVSAIEAQLREHPSAVLRGEARWRSEQMSKDGVALFDVTLSNPGTRRIQVSNPAWESPSGTSGLHLWLRAEEGGKTTVDVLARDIQAIDAWAVTPELFLAPGQQVSFAVRTSLSAVGSGRCKTGLDIRADRSQSATGSVLSGKLSIDMGTITVIDHSGSP